MGEQQVQPDEVAGLMRTEFRILRIGEVEVALSSKWSWCFASRDYGGVFLGPLRIRWGSGWCLDGTDSLWGHGRFLCQTRYR